MVDDTVRSRLAGDINYRPRNEGLIR